MAGGAAADPPPFWLIIITIAVFMGFFLSYTNVILPSSGLVNTFPNDCGLLYVDCINSAIGSVFNILTLLFNILTLGGFNSPLPIIIQAPLFFFFAITWGIIITKMLTNTAAAIIP